MLDCLNERLVQYYCKELRLRRLPVYFALPNVPFLRYHTQEGPPSGQTEIGHSLLRLEEQRKELFEELMASENTNAVASKAWKLKMMVQ